MTTAAAGITGGVENNSTLNLTGGELASDISGTGITTIDGEVTSGKNITNTVIINAAKSFANSGTVSGAVTNNGTLTNTGMLSGTVTNRGTMTTAAAGITGGVENNSTLNLTGGELASYISGSGTTNVTQGTTTLKGGFAQTIANVNEGATLILQGSSFTVNGNVANNGTLESHGTSSLGSVTGTGTLAVKEGTTTVTNGFTQNGLTVAEGAIFEQNGGSFVVNGDVKNEGTVTLNNLGGDENNTKRNNITGKLTNTGTFTLNSTYLTVGAFEGTDVVIGANSKLVIKNETIPENETKKVTEALKVDSVKGKDKNSSTLEITSGALLNSKIGLTDSVIVDVQNSGTTPLAVADNNDKVYENLMSTSSVIVTKKDTTIKINEGAIIGEATMVYDTNGNRTVHEKANRHNASLASSLADSVSFGRMEMNDIRKRLGDVRINNAKNGLWARYENGKNEGSGLDQSFNKFQIGGDTAQSDTWRLGGAVSYTKGSSNYGAGSTDTRTMSGAVYGVMTGKKGEYLDLIARVGVDKHDINAKVAKGDLNNVSFAVSAEVGKTYDFAKNFFVEPQAELTYTRTNGDDFNYEGRNYKLDDSNSLVGRLGFALGYKAPNNRGCIYTRFSVLHEFAGDKDLTVSNNTLALARTTENAGSGSWLEWAIGGQISTSKATYFYADLEKTFNADINEKYRLNVGMRYSF